MPFKDPEKEREYQRKYREENRERLLKGKLEWQKNNPEKKKIAQKRYSEKNKVKLRKKAKEYVKNNPEKRKLTSRNYYQRNKEKIEKNTKGWFRDHEGYTKNYREKNKSILNKKSNLRYKNNKNFRVASILRNSLRHSLERHARSGKIMSSNQYGIDYQAIIEHLKPFPEDLSKYHIDHIKPLCTFDLNDLKQVKLAFAPENLRWLLAEENMRRKRKQIE
jgi:hypothetical protein